MSLLPAPRALPALVARVVRVAAVARVAGVAVLAVGLAVTAVLGSQPAAADGLPGGGVSTQPGAYVGGLLLPPGARPDPPSLPGDAARCDGCVWTLAPACQLPDPDSQAICLGAVLGCPPPALRTALWLQRPTDPIPRRAGTICLVPGTPLQPGALVPGVRDRFVRLVPPLRPSFEPRGRGLVNLPVLLASGQPASLGRPRFVLAGRQVELHATVTWLWDLGDGATIRTRDPGGRWPDTSVSHAYATAGRRAVAVTALWEGEFWVDDVGPFAVTGGPVTQTVPLAVDVVPARAVLVGGWGSRR